MTPAEAAVGINYSISGLFKARCGDNEPYEHVCRSCGSPLDDDVRYMAIDRTGELHLFCAECAKEIKP